MNYSSLFLGLGIAILYNIVVHLLSNCAFKSQSYEDRMNYGIAVIFLSGLLAIVLGKILTPDNVSLSNCSLSIGLLLGGIFLCMTTVAVRWDNISDDEKLLIAGTILIAVVYYLYRKQRKATLAGK